MRRLACAALLALAAQPAAADRLSLATWNLEWMMPAATFDELAADCLGRDRRARGDERAIPCDIVPRARWDAERLAPLAAFAATLTADVIALQETDGPAAAGLVFPDRVFCFTKRRHVQNVGFAIRRGIPYRCNRDYRPLGLAGNDVRWGADMTLWPGTNREVRLLSVHLKSGCHSEVLSGTRPECRVLQEQVPVLEAWIDKRARDGVAFAVLGDFNRRFDRERERPRDALNRVQAMWPELDDGEPAEADLFDTGEAHGAVGCNNGYPARPAIDHIVLGRRLARRYVSGSYRVWKFPDGRRWPDHCALSIEIEMEARNGV